MVGGFGYEPDGRGILDMAEEEGRGMISGFEELGGLGFERDKVWIGVSEEQNTGVMGIVGE